MEQFQIQLTKKERREKKRLEKKAELKQRAKKRNLRRILLWSFVIFAVGAGIFGMVKLVSRAPDNDNLTASVVGVVTDGDWIKGNKESLATLIEYSDFQCPACAYYQPLLKELSNEFGDKINFVYRHFPLKQIHQNAELAAEAAEAAGKQGQFWPMHDLIFENQDKWSKKNDAEDIFIVYAESLGLELERFKSDIKSKEIKEKVDNDYEEGVRAGVNSTPTFFLNGRKIKNPQTYDEFKQIISEAIENNS